MTNGVLFNSLRIESFYTLFSFDTLVERQRTKMYL